MSEGARLYPMFRVQTDTRYQYLYPLGRDGYEVPLDVEFEVGALVWTDKGGASDVEITAKGSENELALLAKYIGRPIDIVDQHGTVVWQGRVHTTSIPEGGYVHTLTMDEFASQIGMAYYKVNSSAEATGVRTQASSVIDTAAQSLYGAQMAYVSRGKLTADEAASELKTLLAQRAKAAYGVQRGNDFDGNKVAKLTCKGEWYYFSRAYYLDNSALEANTEDTPDYTQNLGEGSGIWYLAQSFYTPTITLANLLPIPTMFQASQVTVQVGKVVENDAPADPLTCEIWDGDWVNVGRLVCDTDHGSDDLWPYSGTDADDTSVLVDGYNVADGKPGIPYWLRVGVIFSCVYPSGVREQMRVTAINGGPSPYPQFRVPINITRGENGTTPGGWSRNSPLYVWLPSIPVATACVAASSVSTSVSEMTFTFGGAWTASSNPRWIVIRRDPPKGDRVQSVIVRWGGVGYTSAPTVTFSGGGGTGAAGYATVGSSISTTTVTNGGSGYTNPPTATLSGGGGSGAAVSAVITSGVVTSLIVINPGTGYTSAPTVSFSGGGGTGATATVSIGTPMVTGVTITNGGSGYTSQPTVTLSGGGASADAVAIACMSTAQTWLGQGYYQVRMCSARTYARGEAYEWVKNDGTGEHGTWRPPYPTDAKMWFKVSGTRETTDQLIRMVAQSPFATGAHYAGTGLPGTWPPAQGSQVYTVPYRTGDRSVSDEMQKLLDRGTRDNFPMYAIVGPDRWVTIYKEGDPSTAMLWTASGKLIEYDGSEIPQLPPPVGRWVISEGFRTGTAGPKQDNAFYVAEAQYDPSSDVLELRARTSPPIGQLPSIQDG